jgi:hypothetical protein
MTDPPAAATYVSIVSHESVRSTSRYCTK